MSQCASLVPECPDYLEQAREICRRVQHKEHLTDDELIVLAMVACQLALAQYIEPTSEHDAEKTLDRILGILDHTDIVKALENKMDFMLATSRGIARQDAPGGEALKQLGLGNDPDEPAGD